MGSQGTTSEMRARPPAGPDVLGARALRDWITGERGERSRVIFVEPDADAGAVGEVTGPGDLLLLEEGSPHEGPAPAIHYSGAFSEVGDELFLGERSVELQDYVAAAFIQLVGPTAVRFFDEVSWQAFLDDADLARTTGVFPAPLIDPRVLLADRHAVAAPAEIDTPSALRIRPDGRIGVGVQGAPIGSLDGLPALLVNPLPRAAALGDIAPGRDITADLLDRRWIARYLDAADLMKMLHLANGDAKISGFGWCLLDDHLSDAEPPTTDPFLLETAEGFVLADIRSLRRQLLSPLTARVVAATQTSSTLSLAAERVARESATPVRHARELCREAVEALGVHFGEPVDGLRAEEVSR